MADERREARAEARAAKARAKALRPWYRKKRFLLPIAAVAVIIIAVIASNGGRNGGDGDGGTASQATTQRAQNRLYENRPDAQPEDQERAIGQAATIGGMSATVTSGGFRQSLNDFESEGYLVIDVSIQNASDETHSYNVLDWKLQTPRGKIEDASPFQTQGHPLDSGDLVEGGDVAGSIAWTVGDAKGDYYIIWKPDPFDAARGIWKVTI